LAWLNLRLIFACRGSPVSTMVVGKVRFAIFKRLKAGSLYLWLSGFMCINKSLQQAGTQYLRG
jgi:hypothetical protein